MIGQTTETGAGGAEQVSQRADVPKICGELQEDRERKNAN